MNAATDAACGTTRVAPAVAVVVPTCRRPGLLRRCLQALVRQQGLEPGSYQILVVDDGRSEDTRALVDEFSLLTAGEPAVRYLRPTGNSKGPAAARNCGWHASEARIIAFTDDDTVPDPRWLLHGSRAMARGFAAVSGRVVVPTGPQLTDHALNTKGLERAEFVTANAFVRRDCLARIGGFDERFTRAWREDSDLQFSLLENDDRLGRAEDAVVVHPVREAPWGISMAQQANVYFDALLFAKHPGLYRARVRSRPPWRYFFIVACVPGALAAALAGHLAGAGVLALLCLAGCLSFALDRLRHTSRSPMHVAEMLLTSMAIPFLAVYWRARGAWRFKVLFP